MKLDDVMAAYGEVWLLEDLIPARGTVDCAMHDGAPFFTELVSSVLTRSPMFGCDIVTAGPPSVVYASADPSETALNLGRAIQRQGGKPDGDLLLLPLDGWLATATQEASDATLLVVEDASGFTAEQVAELENAFPGALLLLGNLEVHTPLLLVDMALDDSDCKERRLMPNLAWRMVDWSDSDHIIWSFVYEDSPTEGLVYDARLSFRSNGGGL